MEDLKEVQREIIDEIILGCENSSYSLHIEGSFAIYSEAIDGGDSRVLKVFDTANLDALLGVYSHYLKTIRGIQQIFISKRVGYLSQLLHMTA